MFLASIAAVTACVSAEVTPLTNTPRKPHPEGCPVTLVPASIPSFPYSDIATAEVRCHFTVGRSGCIERLKQETCARGGDTAYAFGEAKFNETHILRATIAYRKPAPIEECEPPCSPGYTCVGTTCVPRCNPECDPGQHCAKDRTCQPGPGG